MAGSGRSGRNRTEHKDTVGNTGSGSVGEVSDRWARVSNGLAHIADQDPDNPFTLSEGEQSEE